MSNVTPADQQPVVFIGEAPFVVIGTLESVQRQPKLLDAVVIPEGAARELYEYEPASTVQIDVEIGAGSLFADRPPSGLVGGVIGASLGVLVVVAISAAGTWTPVLDPWVPFVAPLVGAVTGLVAGLYAALRAARLEPVETLRAS